MGIERTKHGLVFTTKGDANRADDIFNTPASNIVGEVRYTVPEAGYVFLFFGSRQGEIFLGAAAGILVLYFLLGLWEDRRAYLEGVSATMETLRQESDDLRRALEHSPVVTPAALTTAQMPRQTATILERVPTPRPQATVPSLDGLVREVRSANERSEANVAVIQELVGAVSEYGVHLRSHTAVMQHLATTTDKLERAAGQLADAVTSPVAAPGAGLPALRTRTPMPLYQEPFDPSALRSPSLVRIADGYLAEPVERLLVRAADALDAMARDRDDLRERLLRAEAQIVHLAWQHEALLARQPEQVTASSGAPEPTGTPPTVPPVWEVIPPPGR